MRSAALTTELTHRLDVEGNYAFAPKVVVIGGIETSTTWCSAYASVWCAAMGELLPPMLANNQEEWLDSTAGKAAGWTETDETSARNAANLGIPALATLHETPHGHIGCVLPSDDGYTYVTSAGVRCFERTRLANSFGTRGPGVIRFWVAS